jgi:hypothetical protein
MGRLKARYEVDMRTLKEMLSPEFLKSGLRLTKSERKLLRKKIAELAAISRELTEFIEASHEPR